MPWGAHVCHFYSTQQDLLDVAVPFVAEGLAHNERCFWIVVDPLTVDDAKSALRAAVPALDRHEARGSLTLLRYDDWYLPGGVFDVSALATAWKPYLAQALSDGYEGVRGTGSTAWLSKSTWGGFAEYERELDASIEGQRVKAICSYSLPACGPLELLEAARSHPLAVARRDGDYEVIPTAHGRRLDISCGATDFHHEVVPEDEWRRRERANILSAMRRSKGRIYGNGGAAELLALKPSTLQSRIRAFRIRPGEAETEN
jgi:hypothetical protein